MLSRFIRYDHTNYAGGVVCILLTVISYLLKLLQSFSKVILLLREVVGPSIKLIQTRVKNGQMQRVRKVIRISRTPSALRTCRWSLFYNLRSHNSHLTRNMYDVNPDDILIHNNASKSRQALDAQFEDSLAGVLKKFTILDPSYERDHLINVVPKDKSTDLIEDSLLSSVHLGQAH